MCTLSFVILRNVRKKPDIASLMQQFCSSVGCGVNFDSTGAIMELPFLVIRQEDLAFEIYDCHSLINSGIFMSLETPLRADTPPGSPWRPASPLCSRCSPSACLGQSRQSFT